MFNVRDIFIWKGQRIVDHKRIQKLVKYLKALNCFLIFNEKTADQVSLLLPDIVVA